MNWNQEQTDIALYQPLVVPVGMPRYDAAYPVPPRMPPGFNPSMLPYVTAAGGAPFLSTAMPPPTNAGLGGFAPGVPRQPLRFGAAPEAFQTPVGASVLPMTPQSMASVLATSSQPQTPYRPPSPPTSPCVRFAERTEPPVPTLAAPLDLDMLMDTNEIQVALGEPGPVEPKAEPFKVATAELPLALNPPALRARTNPYIDLAEHLRHHGMEDEAAQFSHSQVVCDFVLGTFLTMYAAPNPGKPDAVSDAGEALLCELNELVRLNETKTNACIAAIAAEHTPTPGTVLLPRGLQLGRPAKHPTHPLPPYPTHILAVCPRPCAQFHDGVRVAEEPCVLVPIQWIVYALQCAFLPTPSQGTDGVPVLELVVPFPQYWPLLHRWMYTRDPGKLLAALLPLSTLRTALPGANCMPTTRDLQDTLTCIALPILLRLLLRIRAVWANGRSVGIYADSFWATLARAYDIVIVAVIVRKGRANQKKGTREVRSV